MPGSDYSERWNEARDGREPEELNDEVREIFDEFLEEENKEEILDKSLPNYITKDESN